MNRLLRISALCLLALLIKMQPLHAQTVVYENYFPGSGGLSPSPSGSPILPFIELAGNSDMSPGSVSASQIGGSVGSASMDDNQLAVAVAVAHVPAAVNNGFAFATAPLGGFSLPFDVTLSLNTQIVTWTFNMKTGATASGFAAGQNEAAVVLAADNPDLRSGGNGYAVIYNPGMSLGLQFVRYSGGLSGAITPLITSGALITSSTNYVSVRVTYDPTSDSWSMFLRDDGSVAFADPSTGVTVAAGSVVDGALTAVPLTNFGFYANYSVAFVGATEPDALNAYFDSYVVTLSCPDIEGGLNTCVGLTTTLSHPFAGGVWSSDATTFATVDPVTGIVTGIASGTATIEYAVGTCTVTAVVTVNPDPIPAPITTATAFEVCMGSTLPLGITEPAGTWSSSNPAIGTVDPVTGEVTGIAAGTVMITFTIPTGCFSTADITVHPVAPIGGITTLCEGETYPFTNSIPGGLWESDDPFVAAVDPTTGDVFATGTGVANITYTTPAGCASTISVTVNVNPTPITGSATVCEGLSTPLSSTPPGGFWSSSTEAIATVTDAGLLIGNAVGTALITYKLLSGCQVTLEITVNAQPGSIVGSLSVCQESTTTLSNPLAGGTWTSSMPAIGTIDASGVFTGILAGTSTVAYTMSTGCFRSAIVTVNPTPTPILGIPSVCVGFTTALTNLFPGGAWASSDLAVGTVSAGGVVAGISAGTTRISYSLATGCRRVVEVTVAPLPPAITGTATVCEGRTTDLDNTSAGGTWSSSVPAVGTVESATGIVTGLTVGTTSIVYTIGTGCSATRIVTVIASPAAITGTPTVCIGETTVLANATPAGTWSSSDAGIADVDAGGIVTGMAANTANISYTIANGCFAVMNVTVNPLPGAITGTASVCVNSTTALSATPLPLTGAWSSSDLAVGTVNGTGVVTGLSAGTTTISYTVLGCSRTRVITVNALPSSITGIPSVCLGLTTTLNSTPAGGTWSSSDAVDAPVNAATGVVTGNGTGTANITYTISTGCIRVRNITVNPLPGTIAGSGTVCPGTTITLTNPSPGGAWSHSAATAAFGTVSAGGVVTGITTGTTRISYTLPTGCFTTTVVTVSPAPPSVITPIGDTVLCPGDFVTLTASTTPGVTYQWFASSVAIPGATSPTHIASTAAAYQVRVSATAGCSMMSPSVTVTVVPATATITLPGGATSTCAGTPVLMNANTGTGLTYQWELAGAAIAGATASTFNALTAGNYTVRVTNSAGCWAVSAPVTITVLAAPSNVVTASGPLTFCLGNSVTLTGAAGTGYTYQWHDGAGPITGATSISYTATTAESYHLVVTNSAGCSTTTAASVVNVNPLPDVTITPGGPRIFCVGGIVLLSAAPGFNYQWYRNGTAIAGATNISYVAAVSGNYRVRVTEVATGCTDMTHGDTTVTVISSPTALPLTPAQFCWGGSALLSTSVSGLAGAVSYQWMRNGTTIPGATLSTYNATVGGTYDCNISVPMSCTVLTSSVLVTEVPLPDPPITFSGTAFKTGNFYITYQWYKDLLPIPGATAFSTPATSDGNYKVAVTDTNGCQSVSAVYVLNGWKGAGTTGVSNVNNPEISIFPNPATETVFIESAVNVRAMVSSVDGKVLIDQQNAKEINIRTLADGMYMITLYDDNGQQLKVQKLVKRQ